MKYYPIFVNLEGRACTVIGGGEVGERKVSRLLACGAHVTVISQVITPGLKALREKGRICFIEAAYTAEQLAGAFLVIGATDQQAINETIFRDCRRLGIMVNIVDDPARCDFILPSLHEQGDLSIAVSTSGKSPALAKKIRHELEQVYGGEYSLLLEILGNLRPRIVAAGQPADDNRLIFQALVESPILDAIRNKQWDKVQEIVKRTTGLDIDPPEGALK